MTPDHCSKHGKRYRYYASQKDKDRLKLPVHRIPASEIEALVSHQIVRKFEATWDGPLPSREVVLRHVERVTVHAERIEILFAATQLPVVIEASLIRCGGEVRIDSTSGNWRDPQRDPAMIKLIVRAHQARAALARPDITSIDDAASSLGLSKQYYCRLLRLAHLAPDITVAILDGRQPIHLNRQYLARLNNLPLDWTEQRKLLQFV